MIFVTVGAVIAAVGLAVFVADADPPFTPILRQLVVRIAVTVVIGLFIAWIVPRVPVLGPLIAVAGFLAIAWTLLRALRTRRLKRALMALGTGMGLGLLVGFVVPALLPSATAESPSGAVEFSSDGETDCPQCSSSEQIVGWSFDEGVAVDLAAAPAADAMLWVWTDGGSVVEARRSDAGWVLTASSEVFQDAVLGSRAHFDVRTETGVQAVSTAGGDRAPDGDSAAAEIQATYGLLTPPAQLLARAVLAAPMASARYLTSAGVTTVLADGTLSCDGPCGPLEAVDFLIGVEPSTLTEITATEAAARVIEGEIARCVVTDAPAGWPAPGEWCVLPDGRVGYHVAPDGSGYVLGGSG